MSDSAVLFRVSLRQIKGGIAMKRAIFAVLLCLCAFGVLNAADPVSEALSPFVDSGQMPGMVTVMATADDILAVDCIGWSNVENKKPMAENTMFWMASMTKAFVGCCAAMLADEGKLDLDAPIVTYIPEFAEIQVYKHDRDEEPLMDPGIGHITEAHKPKTPMTVRQCLCHTAGWRFVSPFQKLWGGIDCLDHQRAIASYALMGLDWEPGEGFHYSNIGINVAAAVVERISGKPIEVMMQERIFEPLGMTDTTFWPNEEQMARIATPYEYRADDQKLHALDRIPFLGYPYSDRTKRFAEGGGGLFASATDFVKFYQMIAGKGTYHGKQVMTEGAWKLMTSKQTPEGISKNYGFGLNVGDGDYSHGGAAGTSGNVFKSGLVTVYAVQIKDVPDHGKITDAFFKAAAEYYAELQAAKK